MFKDYFNNHFLKDFNTLNFKRYQSSKNGQVELFFGGENWDNIKNDIATVSESNREDFILSLYFIELIEMNMYANFKSEYASFRAKTLFPKFGFVGMGPHYYYPQNIFEFSSKKGIINLSNIKPRLNEVVKEYINQYEENYQAGVFPIPAKDFFNAVLNDKENLVVDPEGIVSESMNIIAEELHK